MAPPPRGRSRDALLWLSLKKRERGGFEREANYAPGWSFCDCGGACDDGWNFGYAAREIMSVWRVFCLGDLWGVSRGVSFIWRSVDFQRVLIIITLGID